MSNVVLEKRSLRERCKALRLAISPEEKAVADAAILHTVTAHSAFLDADLLLCFFDRIGKHLVLNLLIFRHTQGVEYV